MKNCGFTLSNWCNILGKIILLNEYSYLIQHVHTTFVTVTTAILRENFIDKSTVLAPSSNSFEIIGHYLFIQKLDILQLKNVSSYTVLFV